MALQVVACPGGAAIGHTYFIPTEEHLESGVTTRGFMEARLVVNLAGRCVTLLAEAPFPMCAHCPRRNLGTASTPRPPFEKNIFWGLFHLSQAAKWRIAALVKVFGSPGAVNWAQPGHQPSPAALLNLESIESCSRAHLATSVLEKLVPPLSTHFLA